MPKLLGAKAGKLSIADAMMIAVSKTVIERVARPVIGNATLFSGAIKLGGAFALTNLVGGKMGDIIGTALMVDATEDFVTSFLPMAGGFGVSGGVELI